MNNASLKNYAYSYSRSSKTSKFFKPILATSLVLALSGVVLGADTGGKNISTNGIGLDSDITTDDTSTSAIQISGTTDITTTLNSDVTVVVSDINTSSFNGVIYNALGSGLTATLASSGDSIYKLDIGNGSSGNINSSAGSKIIYNTTGTLEFDNVSVIVVRSNSYRTDTYGIFSNYAGAGYTFGTTSDGVTGKTVFKLTGTDSDSGNGANVVGFAVVRQATASGNLEMILTGGSSVSSTGGSATGIGLFSTSATLILNNSNMTFDLTGGNSTSGTGGDAIGITGSGTIKGSGTITVTSVTAGTKGTGGTDGSDGSSYVIKNTGNLTFGSSSDATNSQIQIVAGSKDSTVTGLVGIYSNLASANYDFGTTGTDFYLTGTDSNPTTGVTIANTATMYGTLDMTVKNTSTGTATGLNLASTLTLADDSDLTLAVSNTGGADENGDAVGIIGSGTITGTGTTSTGVLAAEVSSTNGNATGINIADGSTLTIKDGTTVSLSKIKTGDKATATILSNSGTLNINAGTLAVGDNFVVTGITAGVLLTASTTSGDIGSTTLTLGTTNITNTSSTSTTYGVYATTSDYTISTGNNKKVTFNLSNGTIGLSTYTEGTAFGGTSNPSLTMSSGSTIIFNSNGGTIGTLTSDGSATLNLAGSITGTSQVRGSSNVVTRSLTVTSLNTGGLTFVVYADANATNTNGGNKAITSLDDLTNAKDAVTTSNGSAAGLTDTSKYASTGVSDYVYISSVSKTDNTTNTFDNTLAIALGSTTSSSSSTSTDTSYMILARVDNSVKSNATFNGLTKDGDTTNVQTYQGFVIDTITIGRKDVTGGDAYYYTTGISQASTLNNDFVKPSAAMLSTNYNLLSANLNSLNKRMGELRNNDHNQGAWVRIFNGSETSNFGIKATTYYTTLQTGYDYGFEVKDAKNYVGVALSYINGYTKQATTSVKVSDTSTVAGINSATTNGFELAIYNAYIQDGASKATGWKNGLYSDSVVKLSYFSSSIHMIPTNSTDISNIAFALSEEVGYRFKLGNNEEWYIDPQAELSYAYMNAANFDQTLSLTSSQILNSAQNAVNLFRTRLGSSFGYKFDHLLEDSNWKAQAYIGGYYIFDAIGGGSVSATLERTGYSNLTDSLQALESNGRFMMNIGTNISISDHTRIYFDFEKSFGNKMQTNYQVNIGARFSFGNSAKKVDIGASKNNSRIKVKEIQDIEKKKEGKEDKTGDKEDTNKEGGKEDKKVEGIQG